MAISWPRQFKNSNLSFTLAIFLTSFFTPLNTSSAIGNGEKAGKSGCILILEGLTGVDEFQILAERHNLLELIAADPEQNLVYRHPGSIMEAHQILYSWIREGGVRRTPNPHYGAGEVNRFGIFHEGVFSERRIVGQYAAIQEIVDHVQSAASGDGSASKMGMLWGPHGTGKTEILEIALESAKKITTQNPDHYLYTYHWKNLAGIDRVYPVVNIQETQDGGKFEHPLPCPLNHDAFVLLPKAYQQAVQEMAAPRVVKIAGVKPRPETAPCPLCHEIRNAIILDAIEKKGRPLTPEEQVRVLSEHVEIVRLVPGKGGFEAKMNAEGKNIAWSELGAQPNNFLKEQFGASHPFSYFYGGKLLRANRLFIFFDEFFRNDFALRDYTLEYVENGKIARGGAPTVRVNAFKLAASNTESIEKAESEGGAGAQLDRVKSIPMWWQTHPVEIAETMLVMKTRNDRDRVMMTALIPMHEAERAEKESGNSEDTVLEAKPEPIDFSKVFLLDEKGESSQRLVGPQGRYRLDVVVAADEPMVHLSPHALEMIAYVAAATRLVTNPQEALKYGNFESTVTRPEFYDPITRLKLMTGQLSAPVALKHDILELSRFLKEGTAGISPRNLAHDWLTAAIAKAKLPENHNCVTPEIVKDVFRSLLQDRTIQWKENATLLLWQRLMQQVAYHFTIPSLVGDVMRAVGRDEGILEATYLAVYYEYLELSKSPDSEKYETWNGETRHINAARLKEIREIYREIEKRDLDVGELFNFHGRYQAIPGGRRHDGLEKAIVRYETRHSGLSGGLESILAYARTQRGTVREREKFQGFFHNMKHHLGYCHVCARAAGEIAIEHESGATHLEDGPK